MQILSWKIYNRPNALVEANFGRNEGDIVLVLSTFLWILKQHMIMCKEINFIKPWKS
jgi:hypothetical protein